MSEALRSHRKSGLAVNYLSLQCFVPPEQVISLKDQHLVLHIHGYSAPVGL